jgi:hypothetical protein
MLKHSGFGLKPDTSLAPGVGEVSGFFVPTQAAVLRRETILRRIFYGEEKSKNRSRIAPCAQKQRSPWRNPCDGFAGDIRPCGVPG